MTANRPDPRAAALAAAGGAGFVVVGALVATTGPFGGDYDRPVEYVADVAFALGLACTALALFAVAHAVRAPRRAAVAAALGQSLILTGVLIGLAQSQDPSWFGALAAPGLLLWLGGTAVIGVGAWRRALLPRPAAALLALSVPVGVAPFGEIGGAMVLGALWLWIAARVLRPHEVHAQGRAYAEAA